MKLTREKQEQICKFFKEKAIRIKNFFGRELILVYKRDFDKKKRLFEPVSSFTNNLKNYRTRRFFKHLHAIEDGKYVELHYDYGNWNVNVLGFLIHLISDVIPYFAYHFITRKKPYNIRP